MAKAAGMATSVAVTKTSNQTRYALSMHVGKTSVTHFNYCNAPRNLCIVAKECVLRILHDVIGADQTISSTAEKASKTSFHWAVEKKMRLV